MPCPGVGRVVLVHEGVAVVVHAVAQLGSVGEDGGCCVVAVALDGDVAGLQLAGLQGLALGAVAVAVGVHPHGDDLGGVQVHHVVAVVVLAVAQLDGVGVHPGVAVVAVVVGADVAAGGCAGGDRGAGQAVAVTVAVLVPAAGVHGVVLVHGCVAVVVQSVADLGGVGVGRSHRVVAVTGQRHVTVGPLTGVGRRAQQAPAIVVGIGIPDLAVDRVFIHSAIAVVIAAVAQLGRQGIDLLAVVVAVEAVGHEALGLLAGQALVSGVAEAVLVPIPVPGGGVGGARIHGAVAVVVHAVAALDGGGVHGGIAVVAVTTVGGPAAGLGALIEHARGVTEAVSVQVLVPAGGVGCVVLVGLRVAVVVDAVTQLGGARVRRRAGVVAVVGAGGPARGQVAGGEGLVGHAVAVQVGVDVPGQSVGGVLVHAAVAVVVRAIAGLEGRGVASRIGVVAVATVGEPALGGLAGQGADGRVAEAVQVTVLVPGGAPLRVLVHGTITVVVETVAQLIVARVAGGVVVVAVAGVEHELVGLVAGQRRGEQVAVAVGVAIPVPPGCIHRLGLVHHAVAVVVVAVAVLLSGRTTRLAVVAVTRHRHVALGGLTARHHVGRGAKAVTVRVPVPADLVHRAHVHGAVAVVVDAVADLHAAGQSRQVAVVAVPGLGAGAHRLLAGPLAVRSVAPAVAVPVFVPGGRIQGVLVRQAVAVLVHAVAAFRRVGVDRSIAVVAVPVLVHLANQGSAGHPHGSAAPAVGIGIRVPGGGVHGVVLVHHRVAVVVESVAQLIGLGGDLGVGVIAVA